MTLSEAQTPESSNEQSARVIPFPRGAFEVTEQPQGPLAERQQVRTEFPTSKEFLATLRENGVNSETTGAQIMMLLYESLDLIPKKKEADSLVHLLVLLKQLHNEYDVLLQEDSKGSRLASFKTKLKNKGLTLDDIDAAKIAELEQQLAQIRNERAPMQELTRIVEQRFADFIAQNEDGRSGGFSDKIQAIYEETDEFVEGDELLELAQQVRKTAMQTTDKGLVAASRTFERFTRFMIFDDNRTAAKYEEQSNPNSTDA